MLVSKIRDLEGLAKSKSNWIDLFADFEKRIYDAKDVWLDDLKVVRSMKGGKPDYRLQLSGRFLLRDVDPEKAESYDAQAAIEKMKKLLTSFKESEFIDEWIVEGTNRQDPRILKFNFTLVVNPDKPI